jgi:hypothetical protein
MAKTLYCWRCKADIPMLDEQEWQEVSALLGQGVQNVKNYRRDRNATLAEVPKQLHDAGALERYFEMTGYRETDVNVLWHHRLSQFGPPCESCGRPLRAPQAKICAECGAVVRR